MIKGKNIFKLIVIGLVAASVTYGGLWIAEKSLSKKVIASTQEINETVQQITPSLPEPTVTIPATPSAKPIDMNKEFGPCVDLPVLMYHHVEPNEDAVKNKRTGLNVTPEIFKEQMSYLVSKGYQVISEPDLIGFFDTGSAIPKKSVIITFDDGYTDVYKNVFPILKELKIKISVYLPTGLMENPDYLKWNEIKEMQESGYVRFGNHTWSHINVAKDKETVKKELQTADTQLNDNGLNNPKTFVYPYGLESDYAVKVLEEMSYKLAFTTHHGRLLCEGKRMNLPRIRIGNTSISAFGL